MTRSDKKVKNVKWKGFGNFSLDIYQYNSNKLLKRVFLLLGNILTRELFAEESY